MYHCLNEKCYKILCVEDSASLFLSLSLSIYLSIYLPLYLSISPSIYLLYIYLFLSLLFLSLSLYLSISGGLGVIKRAFFISLRAYISNKFVRYDLCNLPYQKLNYYDIRWKLRMNCLNLGRRETHSDLIWKDKVMQYYC